MPLFPCCLNMIPRTLVCNLDLPELIPERKQDKVEDCCRLIQEVATSVDFHSSNKRKMGSVVVPGSPKGVMDVCFSSDSSLSCDSWAVSSSVASSVSSSPAEPLSKKMKPQTTQSPKNAIF